MFTTDTRSETFLTQMGVEYSYSNKVGFAELAGGWNVKNWARPVPIRDEAVMEYASLMEAGSPAPAPILHRTNEGYNVLDGVQRLAAAELNGITKLSAYLVTCDSEDVLMAIRVLANARLQGHPEPPEWSRRHAVEMLVIQRGMSTEEVASMGGWKPSEITRLRTILDWGFKIRCIGGPCLPDNLIETISQHTTQDNLTKAPKPICKFLNTLKQVRFSNSEASPLVEQFFKPISHSSKLHDSYEKRLAEIMDEPEVQVRLHGRQGSAVPRHVLLQRTLKSAETIATELAASQEDVRNVDEYFRLLKAIGKQVHRMAPHSPRPKTADVPADMWSDDAQD